MNGCCVIFVVEVEVPAAFDHFHFALAPAPESLQPLAKAWCQNLSTDRQTYFKSSSNLTLHTSLSLLPTRQYGTQLPRSKSSSSSTCCPGKSARAVDKLSKKCPLKHTYTLVAVVVVMIIGRWGANPKRGEIWKNAHSARNAQLDTKQSGGVQLALVW